MITDVSAAACKHLTEKLMRGGLGAAPRPQRGVWVGLFHSPIRISKVKAITIR